MSKFLLIIGVLIFLIGLGADVFYGWFSLGYTIARIGMVAIIIGMIAFAIKKYRESQN